MRAISEKSRRYLAVWFPWLASDRRRDAGGPFVLVENDRNALRLSAVSPEAARIGLKPGMTLADTRARVPDIICRPAEPEQDAALLRRVLIDFGRFTPMATADGPDSLILDVTGCTHLFGGEKGLIARALDRAGWIGLQARAAMASTPQAARALARFGPGGVIPSGEDRAAVRRLPVEALELPDADLTALRRAGLKTVAAVDDRPRAALAARFGKTAAWKVDRVLGLEDVRITPFRPPDPCVVDRVLMEPISTDEDVHRVLADLLGEAALRLERTGLGGRTFRAAFFRVDGHVRRISVQAGRPTRDAVVVMRLFRERLASLAAPLDPGFGFDQMRLSVARTEPLTPAQVDLDQRSDPSSDFDGLIDRLSARLGQGAVLRFEPRDSHIPEHAMRLSPAGAGSFTVWPNPERDETPLRPLHLFDPPQPVEAMAAIPDDPPRRFQWRCLKHDVVLAEGPERIAAEWWRKPAHVPTRDYYRVEDSRGRRFWLFREGLYGQDADPRWFIHGMFA